MTDKDTIEGIDMTKIDKKIRDATGENGYLMFYFAEMEIAKVKPIHTFRHCSQDDAILALLCLMKIVETEGHKDLLKDVFKLYKSKAKNMKVINQSPKP